MKNRQRRNLPTVLLFIAIFTALSWPVSSQGKEEKEEIKLPAPSRSGGMSLSEALAERRSFRSFRDEAVTLEDAAQILWAGKGKRTDGVSAASLTAPSAGGLYPAELFLVAGMVEGIPAGVYSYDHLSHTLSLVKEGDVRGSLTKAGHINRR